MSLRVELSTDTVEGAVAADELGADRVELCAAGALGGLTPGPGLLTAVLARCHRTSVHVLVRPREGAFAYHAGEVDAMLTDVRYAVTSGAAGVVVGALTPAGELDVPVLRALVAAADGLPVTMHRAVDVCADPVAAVETLAELGIRRVLSSGAAPRAEDGAETLARMVTASAGRVAVMACGGIRPHNALAIAATTGVEDLHAAPRRAAPATATGAVAFGTHATLDVDTARDLVRLAHG